MAQGSASCELLSELMVDSTSGAETVHGIKAILQLEKPHPTFARIPSVTLRESFIRPIATRNDFFVGKIQVGGVFPR